MLIVRKARSEDINQIVELLETRRSELETWAPKFWKKSPKSAAISSAFFKTLLEDPNVTVLVAQDEAAIVGCLQYRPTFVPPVYEPGGTTWMVDDFVVSANDWDGVGKAMLSELEARTIDETDGQLIFPVPKKDDAASGFFETAGLMPTTVWWTHSKPDRGDEGV
mgnify:CR=1 FL=1